jgi:hypothetical protein
MNAPELDSWHRVLQAKVTELHATNAALAARLAEAERLLCVVDKLERTRAFERAANNYSGWSTNDRRSLETFLATAVSATACLGGAPHWWDINANTGLPECRLCHKSPDPSAKESL